MKENLIAGIISGLIVTLFAIVFREIWNRWIEPWFEDRVYKDVHIEGQWFSLYPSTTEERQEIVFIKRSGHRVSGSIVCSDGPDKGEKYIFSGSFRNLILPLLYESADKKKSDRGTITLRLVRNAERLQGKLALYNTLKDTITTTDVIWFRAKEDLNEFVEEMRDHESAVKDLRMRQRQAEEASRKVTNPEKSAGPDTSINVESNVVEDAPKKENGQQAGDKKSGRAL